MSDIHTVGGLELARGCGRKGLCPGHHLRIQDLLLQRKVVEDSRCIDPAVIRGGRQVVEERLVRGRVTWKGDVSLELKAG